MNDITPIFNSQTGMYLPTLKGEPLTYDKQFKTKEEAIRFMEIFIADLPF